MSKVFEEMANDAAPPVPAMPRRKPMGAIARARFAAVCIFRAIKYALTGR